MLWLVRYIQLGSRVSLPCIGVDAMAFIIYVHALRSHSRRRRSFKKYICIGVGKTHDIGNKWLDNLENFHKITELGE